MKSLHQQPNTAPSRSPNPWRLHAGARRQARALALPLVAGISLWAAVALRAEPLAKEACDGIVAEQEKLVAAGVKGWLAQGPQGALARLGTDKLAQVERYILLDEQLVFRCGLFKTRTILPPDIEDAVPEAQQAVPTAKPGEQASEPSPASPAAKVPAKAAPTDAKKAKPVAETSQAKPKPQSPPAKKPKADDAFRPPATE